MRRFFIFLVDVSPFRSFDVAVSTFRRFALSMSTCRLFDLSTFHPTLLFSRQIDVCLHLFDERAVLDCLPFLSNVIVVDKGEGHLSHVHLIGSGEIADACGFECDAVARCIARICRCCGS